MRAKLAVITGFMVCACGPDTFDSASEPGEHAWDRLEQGVELHATPGGIVSITGRATHGAGDVSGTADIEIQAAHVSTQIDPDGVMHVDALSLSLEDVVVRPNDVPVLVAGIEVTLAEPIVARPRIVDFDLGTVQLIGKAYIDLAWGIRGYDGVYSALAGVRLGPLPILIELRLDRDVMVGHVAMYADGEIWNFAGLLRLEDPIIDFDVTEQRTVP